MPAGTATRPKLNPAIARAIVTVINSYKRADRALKEAKRIRAEKLPQYESVVPYGVEVEGAGHIIKRWRAGGGQTFSLKDYLAAGNEVSPEMAPFVSTRQEYDIWDAKPIEGPADQ